eukprot:scaffold2927_cov408-Prasinococcus_capsulatus_cf.AAC.3
MVAAIPCKCVQLRVPSNGTRASQSETCFWKRHRVPTGRRGAVAARPAHSCQRVGLRATRLLSLARCQWHPSDK